MFPTQKCYSKAIISFIAIFVETPKFIEHHLRNGLESAKSKKSREREKKNRSEQKLCIIYDISICLFMISVNVQDLSTRVQQLYDRLAKIEKLFLSTSESWVVLVCKSASTT